MKDMFRHWWTGPAMFAVVGAPVASAVGWVITLAESPDLGRPFDPMLLMAVPLGLIAGTFFALVAGFLTVLLGGAVSAVLARSRMGAAPYTIVMAALSAALAVAGFWIDLFGWRRGEAFDVQQAWQYAAGWAAGGALVCVLFRRKGRPAPEAGT